MIIIIDTYMRAKHAVFSDRDAANATYYCILVEVCPAPNAKPSIFPDNKRQAPITYNMWFQSDMACRLYTDPRIIANQLDSIRFEITATY